MTTKHAGYRVCEIRAGAIPLNHPVGFVERNAVLVNAIVYAHNKVIRVHMFDGGWVGWHSLRWDKWDEGVGGVAAMGRRAVDELNQSG